MATDGFVSRRGDVVSLRPFRTCDEHGRATYVVCWKQEVDGRDADILNDCCLARARLSHDQEIETMPLSGSDCAFEKLLVLVPDHIASLRKLRHEQSLIFLQRPRRDLARFWIDPLFFEFVGEVFDVIAGPRGIMANNRPTAVIGIRLSRASVLPELRLNRFVRFC